jgi:23S rRNA (cytidine1920-2'-O)/16S rRNA (cytidine1409-2'-O)-methyltransferase
VGKPKRVDLLLLEKGLAETRARAQALILSGRVYSGDLKVEKPGIRLDPEAPLSVRETLPFVSRGGIKLRGALDSFGIDPSGSRCVDVGASTGGFTDCLLQAGAAQVYAVDVGYGQLDWKLRNDERVMVLERTNFRKIGNEVLPGDLDLAVVDVSFISLRLILPRLTEFMKKGAQAVVLIKPQFEVGKGKVGKGGIVRDEGMREAAVAQVLSAAKENGFEVIDTIQSPIKGATGNVEYLAHLVWRGSPGSRVQGPE